MNLQNEYGNEFLDDSRGIAKQLADIVEEHMNNIEDITPGQQGYIYQMLAAWFLGCSQMIAQVIDIPEDRRDKLFNMCIQESLRITEHLLGVNDTKQ